MDFSKHLNYVIYNNWKGDNRNVLPDGIPIICLSSRSHVEFKNFTPRIHSANKHKLRVQPKRLSHINLQRQYDVCVMPSGKFTAKCNYCNLFKSGTEPFCDRRGVYLLPDYDVSGLMFPDIVKLEKSQILFAFYLL